MATTLKPADIIGKRVRLHSSHWVKGYCDGVCTGYDRERWVAFFQPEGASLDDPTYEVRIYGETTQFELL